MTDYHRLRGFLAEVERIGRYEVIGRLGEGGMGVVFEARDPDLERTVAIKMCKARDGDREAVRKEAAAAAKLRHPNIVTVHEVGPDFIVMDLVRGRTLAAASADLAPVARVRAVATVVQAVAFAHAQGIVHGDLKPSNVLLETDGRAVLTDFGLARLAGANGPIDEADRHTKAGTLAYMAPEQVRDGAAASPVSDVWSLGVMLYEALTGQRPFVGDSPNALRAAIAAGISAPVLAAARGSGGTAYLAIIARALDPEPARRFPDAGALAIALTATDDTILARGRRRKQLRRWALGLLIPGAFGLWMVARAPAPDVGQRAASKPGASERDVQDATLFTWSQQEQEWSRKLAEVSDQPARAAAYLGRGRVRLRRGEYGRDHGRNPFPDWAAAENDLTLAQAGSDGRPSSATATAALDVLLARGQLYAQRCAYKRLLLLDPTSDCLAAEADLSVASARHAQARTWRGNARFHRGVWATSHGEDGRPLFERALEDLSHDEQSDTLMRRGRVRSHLGHFAEAERDFKAAAAADPNSAWLWTWWGQTRRQAGDAQTAEQYFSRALQNDPRHAEALAERGQVRAARGDHRLAVADLEAAIASNPALEPVLAEALGRSRKQLLPAK